jgi:hypothetical protein
LDVRKPDDVDTPFDQARAFGVKGLLNAVDTFINSRRFVLSARAVQHKLPVVYSDVEYVSAGGLIALGPGPRRRLPRCREIRGQDTPRGKSGRLADRRPDPIHYQRQSNGAE